MSVKVLKKCRWKPEEKQILECSAVMFVCTVVAQGHLVMYSPCTMSKVPGIAHRKYMISWPCTGKVRMNHSVEHL